jgi:hypothetical protein
MGFRMTPEIEEKLEPEVQGYGYELGAALSAAISLKRIADCLDANTSHTYNEPAFRFRGDIA